MNDVRGDDAFRGLSEKSRLQVFSYTADKEIRTDDLCLDVSRLNGPVVMLKCHHMKGNQMFEYDAEVRFHSEADPQPASRAPDGRSSDNGVDEMLIDCVFVSVMRGKLCVEDVKDAKWNMSVCLLPPDGAVCQFFIFSSCISSLILSCFT